VTLNTIAEKLRARSSSLTRAERQLAASMLENYPVSGLGSITKIAEAAKVSTPTVGRLVQKLGFSGFPNFQESLRAELDEKISGPIAKRERWVNDAPEEHILNRFTKSVIDNMSRSLGDIDPTHFDEACTLLSDPTRKVFVVGGRITRTLADYFFLHMQVIRKSVTHISSSSNAWAHYLLDIDEGDIVVIFDIRRYENSTLRLAEMAKEKSAFSPINGDRPSVQTQISVLTVKLLCHLLGIPMLPACCLQRLLLPKFKNETGIRPKVEWKNLKACLIEQSSSENSHNAEYPYYGLPKSKTIKLVK
jgi:DNA-binding MurR/RpiR family transcriptional regulator